jgi:GNAT superfamily N-acetyltransferase
LWIGPASPHWHAAALSLLEIDRVVYERLKPAVDAGQVAIQVALCNGVLVGAGWCRMQPGGVAIVVPPRVAPSEPASTALALLEELHAFARRHGARLTQATLASDGGQDSALFSAQGYEHVADLVRLSTLIEASDVSQLDDGLTYERCSPADSARLRRVLEETYEDSRDLRGMRLVPRAQDQIETYGPLCRDVVDPWWFVVREKLRDVGCVLLAATPQIRQWEVLYLGLVPHVRGRGWGHKIVRFARHCTASAGRTALLATVDAANLPALATYAASGFVPTGRAALLARYW